MGFDQATMGGREEESRGQGSWEVIKHRFESDEKGKQEHTKKSNGGGVVGWEQSIKQPEATHVLFFSSFSFLFFSLSSSSSSSSGQ